MSKRLKVGFGELRLGEEAKANLMSVVGSNWASEGPLIKQFEAEWGKLFGYPHNVAVSSGTAADTAACIALYDFGARRGDEIIAPALAFAAVGESILMAGFKPVFVDIRRDTLNIDPEKIEEKITSKTRAILLAHTMGKPCEMNKITEIAKKYDLLVIEDSCEAHGAKYKGEFVGNWGDMAAFSFYAAHLVCCGEGGMVSTNREEVAKVLRSVKSHGRKDGQLYFDHVRFGGNFKMTDLEAAVGLPQLKTFWDTFNKRRNNVLNLIEKTLDLQDYAFFNTEEPDDLVCGHAFSVTLKDPKYDFQALAKFLQDSGIECKRNFGSMPTQHRAFRFLGHKLGEFPEAEYVGEQGLHFGVHQYLTREQIYYTSEKLHEYFSRFK